MQQRGDERAERRAEPLERPRSPSTAAGSARTRSRIPPAAPSRHGPRYVTSPYPPIPCAPRLRSAAVSAIGTTATTSIRRPSGRSSASSASTRQSCAVGEGVAGPPPRAAGDPARRGSGGMCASSSRFAARRWSRPAAGRRGSRGRRAPAPSRLSSAATPIADDREQPERAERDHQRDRRRARGSALDTPRQLELRHGDRRVGVHGVSTSTSPAVLSAWIWNGASSAAVSPTTRRVPLSVSTSTR